MNDLRRQAAEFIVQRLKTASVAQVADKLGVSRQAIYDIKNGKYCPSMTLIQKACQVWDARFEFGPIQLDRTSFPSGTPQEAPIGPQQMLLDLSQLRGSDFEIVAAKPVNRALEITLRLRIPDTLAG
jgi:DNA-binding XRE family transcriptional regulator